MRTLTIIFLSLGFLTGCSFVDAGDSSTWTEGHAVATSVEVESVATRRVTFRYAGSTPSPCHSFDRIETSRSGQTVHVSVLVRTEADVCIGIPGTIEESISVPVPSAGTYTFVFPSADQPITIEVAVP